MNSFERCPPPPPVFLDACVMHAMLQAAAGLDDLYQNTVSFFTTQDRVSRVVGYLIDSSRVVH